MIGQKLQEAWGQQVIADNRPGANGVVAAEITAKANPDGHTLMFVAIGHAINPLLQKNLPYDADKDFAAVSLTAILPQMVALNPKSSATNLKELLALAKGPKPVNYATGGVGSSQHLATELMAYMAKVKLNHIPYKGGNQGLLDVIAGHVDFTITTALTVVPHMQAKRVRALAVSTAKRLDVAPDVPTMAEAGIPGYESVAWYGMVAPAGIPPKVMEKLAAETIKATNSVEMKTALIKQGAIPVGNTPKEFTAFIKNERAKYAKVIKEAGIKAE
jgi:tripartite-type tricarboxylate transporter receptor subunit TctC